MDAAVFPEISNWIVPAEGCTEPLNKVTEVPSVLMPVPYGAIPFAMVTVDAPTKDIVWVAPLAPTPRAAITENDTFTPLPKPLNESCREVPPICHPSVTTTSSNHAASPPTYGTLVNPRPVVYVWESWMDVVAPEEFTRARF